MRVGLVVVALFALAGCGGDDPSAKEMKGARAAVDLAATLLLTSEDAGDAASGTDPKRVTSLYIETLRDNVPVLGAEDARRRLTDLASDVDDWCPDCAAALDRERDRLG